MFQHRIRVGPTICRTAALLVNETDQESLVEHKEDYLNFKKKVDENLQAQRMPCPYFGSWHVTSRFLFDVWDRFQTLLKTKRMDVA